MRSTVLASLLLVSAVTHAQQPTGSVTGTVLAQDTRRPIRFASVQFQSVGSVANANGARFGGFGGGTQARTEIDGTFVATGLEPGDYYVTASAPGYVPERALLAAAVANGSDPGQLLAGLPTVHVDSGGSSSVNLTLQRGGALGGRLVWEDGSPAAGVQVSAANPNAAPNQALPAPLQGLMLTGYGQLTTTDDRGEFRISGLPSGDYQVIATIQSRPQFAPGGGSGRTSFPSTLRVYAPGVFRKSGAKTYPVRSGEERMDLRMMVDLRSLRTVSGHVGSTDGSRTPASGRVSVTDASDSSLVLQGAIDASGSFTIRYVPSGNYTLSISGASTRPATTGFRRGGDDASTTPATSFQNFSQAIVVTDTDLSGVNATLTPAATPTTSAN
jgi:hypothetical protein